MLSFPRGFAAQIRFRSDQIRSDREPVAPARFHQIKHAADTDRHARLQLERGPQLANGWMPAGFRIELGVHSTAFGGRSMAFPPSSARLARHSHGLGARGLRATLAPPERPLFFFDLGPKAECTRLVDSMEIQLPARIRECANINSCIVSSLGSEGSTHAIDHS
jgi:hypothetical protein